MGEELVIVYRTPPKGFQPIVEAAACHVVCGNVSLWLKQPVGKAAAGSWVMPGGKLEPGESPLDGALRELFEETGIATTPQNTVFIGTFYIVRPEAHFTFHAFRVFLDQLPTVHLSHEHTDSCWATLEELKQMPLIGGAWEVLNIL